MKTNIRFGPAYATLSVDLHPGESINAEPGAMVHQSNVDLHTGAPGGIFKGLRRMLAKESFFINTFTGRHGGGNVTLAPNTPGDIIRHPMEPGDAILIQAASFLASSSRVIIDTSFQGLRGILGGEGAFFLKASVPSPHPGTVFFNAYGAVQQLDIIDRELVVDTGHLVAFTDKLDYSIGKVGGLRSLHRRWRGTSHEVPRRRGHRLGPDAESPVPRRPVNSPPPHTPPSQALNGFHPKKNSCISVGKKVRKYFHQLFFGYSGYSAIHTPPPPKQPGFRYKQELMY